MSLHRRLAAIPAARRAARRAAPVLAACCLAVLLAGCAGFQPGRIATGQDEAAVTAALGVPTGRYALPDGARRLEYARGPIGRQTWMVDLDASGHVRAVVQALNVDNFAQVHAGMGHDEVLRLLGRPGFRQHEYQDRETWSWRFDNPFCLWAQVTFNAHGLVIDGVAQSSDPRCTPDR